LLLPPQHLLLPLLLLQQASCQNLLGMWPAVAARLLPGLLCGAAAGRTQYTCEVTHSSIDAFVNGIFGL
jgi:hypothetical protein